MVDYVISLIFWVLAIYGFIEIVKNVLYIFKFTKLKTDGIYFIVAVKNQEKSIEGFLRSIIFKIFYNKEEYIKNIIIADLNSTDSTMDIAKKLSEDNEYVNVTTWKECKKIIDNVNETK